jgi:DNA-binding XRE family transcriptional regulator
MTESHSLKSLKHLPAKLLKIRHRLAASPSQMATLLDHAVSNQEVCEYESGISEPDWLVLLRYAKLAHVSMDALVDDNLELTFPRS